MLKIYCWRCGTKINEEDILGLGSFDKNVGKYSGKGFIAFNCRKCNKARYQILDANYAVIKNKLGQNVNNNPKDAINIDQVIEFHKLLKKVNTVDSFIERCVVNRDDINNQVKKSILQPLDVYNLFFQLNNENMKRLMILTLNKENQLLSWEFMGEGSNRPISFEPRDVFHTPFLIEEEVSIIIAHNLNRHFKEPSQQEIFITRRLQKAGKLLGIEFLDHIIIEDRGFHSFDQLNYI